MNSLRWIAAPLLLCFLPAAASAQSAGPSGPASQTAPASREQVLNRVARVASVMINGDICQHIVTPRAMSYLLDKNKDPRDRSAAGDNYDVNTANFNRIKKTTMRLALLAPFPVDVNLWMPVATKPPRIQIVIRNHYDMSQFWVWGKLTQKMFPEMAEVLKTGKRVTVRKKPGMISVLAPVRNSLGKIVGLVEVVTGPNRTRHD